MVYSFRQGIVVSTLGREHMICMLFFYEPRFHNVSKSNINLGGFYVFGCAPIFPSRYPLIGYINQVMVICWRWKAIRCHCSELCLHWNIENYVQPLLNHVTPCCDLFPTTAWHASAHSIVLSYACLLIRVLQGKNHWNPERYMDSILNHWVFEFYTYVQKWMSVVQNYRCPQNKHRQMLLKGCLYEAYMPSIHKLNDHYKPALHFISSPSVGYRQFVNAASQWMLLTKQNTTVGWSSTISSGFQGISDRKLAMHNLVLEI